jgi:anti-sigma B factor antagonist
MPLHLVEKVIDGVIVLDARGRITLGQETEALRSALSGMLAAGRKRIVLNLGGVDYIDSAGLGILAASAASTRHAGGELKLVNLTRRVRDLMQITRLSTLFEVYDTVEKARVSFGPLPA